MTLHLVKLCVGAASIEDLAVWQKQRLAEQRKAGEKPRLFHTTFQTPKRDAELLDGGSLYWVIKGNIQCRQRLTDIRTFTDDQGISRCHLVLEPRIVPTEWQPRRAFQGWRYLSSEDVPMDEGQGKSGRAKLPPELRNELASLGLL